MDAQTKKQASLQDLPYNFIKQFKSKQPYSLPTAETQVL